MVSTEITQMYYYYYYLVHFSVLMNEPWKYYGRTQRIISSPKPGTKVY